jgi:hypothetical protein
MSVENSQPANLSQGVSVPEALIDGGMVVYDQRHASSHAILADLFTVKVQDEKPLRPAWLFITWGFGIILMITTSHLSERWGTQFFSAAQNPSRWRAVYPRADVARRSMTTYRLHR